MKVLYIAPVRDFSGYATAARGYIRALHDAGANLVVRPVRYDQADPGTEYKPTELEAELLKRDLNGVDVVIQHVTPNEMRPAKGKINIAVTAWETTRIPKYWADKLNQFNAVITFCNASVQAFKDSGVTVPIYKVPHTFDMKNYDLDGVTPVSSAAEPDFLSKRFVFYNISQFSTKKGLDLLLRAYYGVFHGMGDKVILLLKTYVNMAGRSQEREHLQRYIETLKSGMRLPPDGYPPVMLVTKTLTEEQIRKIHKTGNCYVCSSRGEGWCVPAFEALAYGNKLITTTWGGMGEFTLLNEEDGENDGEGMYWANRALVHNNVLPVNFSIEPMVGQVHADPELYTSFDKVAEPSVSSIMQRMMEVYNEKGTKNIKPNLDQFDYKIIGPKMLEMIESVAGVKV